MKILLVEDVEKLGWLGDVVNVNDGYARNYLLPQGLAQPVTDANIKAIADEKEKRAQERLVEAERAAKACEAVDGAEVVIAAKANEQGHLFGSIAEKAIAENLRAQGFSVADEVVRLPEHIKEVGSYSVTLKFAEYFDTETETRKELTAIVNVIVVAEGQELPISKEQDEEETAESAESTDREDTGESADTNQQ